jgi:2-polyprenyl-6-methoxyphenol hydroxylase-like FAD-dependent oxidoreductase
LHNVLTTTAKEKGTSVRLGVTVSEFSQTEDKVNVEFTDGTNGEYDLVIAADGIHSKMRKMVFPESSPPVFSGQSVWRHNFPRPAEVTELLNFVGGQRGSAGLCPLADNLMYMFVTSEEPGNPQFADEDLPRLMRDRLEGFGGILAELRGQIVDPKEVVYRPLEYLMLPDPWYQGRILIIGDAAHATTPHLGQGAGMAIEDAIVAAEELTKNVPISEAMSAFMKRRFDRCKYIVEESVKAGKWEMERNPNADRAGQVKKMLEVTAQPI